jgi:hypothetical protein
MQDKENTTDEPNSTTYFKVLRAFAKEEPVQVGLPTLAALADLKHPSFFRKMQ